MFFIRRFQYSYNNYCSYNNNSIILFNSSEYDSNWNDNRTGPTEEKKRYIIIMNYNELLLLLLLSLLYTVHVIE